MDGRALAYCGALLVTVAKAEAESQRLTSQILVAAASQRGILSTVCSRRLLRIISVFSVC